MTEHVPHDDEVRVFVVNGNAIHAEELREQCDAVTLYNVLEHTHRYTHTHCYSKPCEDLILLC